jgi:hypothetical protein
MTCHDPQGKNVLIHSVCVAGHRRRAKVATRMLREYLERCSQAGYSSVVLVCHDELKPLYMGVGFEDRGPSSLVHGARPWSELMLHLPLKNPTRLLCPVERCRCVILRKGVGRFMTMPESPVSQCIPLIGKIATPLTDPNHDNLFFFIASCTSTHPIDRRVIEPVLASIESDRVREHWVFKTGRTSGRERETVAVVWCLRLWSSGLDRIINKSGCPVLC